MVILNKLVVVVVVVVKRASLINAPSLVETPPMTVVIN